MGAATSKAVWYWRSDDNPWLPTDLEEWKEFFPAENKAIEKAFKSRAKVYEASEYTIKFSTRIQINKKDPTKQRPVKRVHKASDHEQMLSHHRCCPSILSRNGVIPFHKEENDGTAWVTAIEQREDINVESTQEIIEEMVKFGLFTDRPFFGKMVEKEVKRKIKKGFDCVQKYIVRLYTGCQLYRTLNEALREGNFLIASMLNTYCSFLIHFLNEHIKCNRLSQKHATADAYQNNAFVYRGINLTSDQINHFKQLLSQQNMNPGKEREKFYFPSFTSTSRCKVLAQTFGKTLFIIRPTLEICETCGKVCSTGVYLAKLSCFSTEKEVLFPPYSYFYLDDIKTSKAGKNEIYLTFTCLNRKTNELRHKIEETFVENL